MKTNLMHKQSIVNNLPAYNKHYNTGLICVSTLADWQLTPSTEYNINSTELYKGDFMS